jgi:hypothetical protein
MYRLMSPEVVTWQLSLVIPVANHRFVVPSPHLQYLCFFLLDDRITEDEMGDICSKQERTRNSCKILVVNPVGKSQVGSHRHK